MTSWERALRALSWALFAISLGFVGVYLYYGLFEDADYPFTTNSVAKDLLLAGLALLVARDVRGFGAIGVPLIVLAHLALAAVLLVTGLFGRDTAENTLPIAERWPWFAADVVIAAVFTGVSFMAVRSRYRLRYLWPAGYRALTALAEVLVDDRRVTPDEVGARVDAYLARFRSAEKIKVWVALQALGYWPVVTLRPPFHLMSPQTRRRWIERRFLVRSRLPRFLRDLRQAMIRTAQQFSFMGYYGDERAARDVGYLPFSQRSPHVARTEKVAPGGLTCIQADGDLAADVVIVGSGAAGAMLAHELAKRDRNVLVLERGSHVDASTFTENEADQLARLYRDGALTLSKDFRFQVAQGMCVGGSTVVNNGVCFDLPDSVRDHWLDDLNAGLDAARLAEAFRYVRDFLRIAPLAPSTIRNPGAEHLGRILEHWPDGKPPPLTLSVVECNIDGCLGSGYCNIGCAYGKKLSALDWTLPEAQRKYPGKVRVLPDCHVLKVGLGGKVEGRLAGGRRVIARAGQAVVLSAGALASSVILQRSGLGGRRVGEGLSFNVASPVTLDFEQELHSERGAQITHYHERGGVMLESWFNPVVTQSLFMPGWFDAHRANMRRYRHMTCLGVVVGTEANGRVKPGLTRGGVDLAYEPTETDFDRIKRGVALACEIGLRLGAKRVLPTTLRGLELERLEDLRRIETEIRDTSELLVSSAHPQGGNAISADPGKGVVNPHFQVHDIPGLFVCDASVFPSSITVNPQLTVMALAAYAAEEIASCTSRAT